AAFTAALLNHQPMGFYNAATLVKDAQRHGLRVLPIDVMRSQWSCTLETMARSSQPEGGGLALRVGLRYARGLRQEAAEALVRQPDLKPFSSIRDLVRRVPELRKDELITLGEIGALNSMARSAMQIPESEIKDATLSPLSGGDAAVRPKSETRALAFHRRD